MQTAPLTPSQKTEILRRQAFKCNQCQTDLEPIGSAPPHFEQIGQNDTKGSSPTSNFRAFCPACHAMKAGSDSDKTSDPRKRRQGETRPSKGAMKFVKSGIDTRKF